MEPGLTYDASANISFSMSLTIGDGLTVEIPSHELGMLVLDLCDALEDSILAVRPLRGLDDDGAPVVNTSLTEVQVFTKEGPGQGPVLGKVFLSQVVLPIQEPEKLIWLTIDSFTCLSTMTTRPFHLRDRIWTKHFLTSNRREHAHLLRL
jgi:hypothetical protein